MRIQATVEINNNDVNMRTKPTRTSIAIGKKPLTSKENSSDPKVFMMLCTNSNRAGTKFNVCGNISHVFDKNVDKGMCTIQMIKPNKTIFISKADPLQLKGLRNMLKKVLNAKTDEELDQISLTSAALMGASLAQVTKPKEKMVISQKKDYPITSKSNFPSSLTELKVNGVNLKKFDSRMLKLSRLVILDLSDNNIAIWPESLSGLVNLKELHMSNNQLAKGY